MRPLKVRRILFVFYFIFFFFQAEDGIRDYKVTGVQTDRKSTRLNSSHLVISYAVSLDRKSTRLNSRHLVISYAVFCLKKKKSYWCELSVRATAVATDHERRRNL